ncbi:MAG: outer membrane beta-barrel protein [Nitrospinaceae bacterium]
MRKFSKNLVLIFFAWLVLPGTASADQILELLKDIEVHGFASSSYSFNFNEPTTQAPNAATNINRVFDSDHNSFKFDVGELVLLKEVPKKGDVGFRTDITYGFSVPEVAKSAASPGDVQTHDFDVQQGYVSYNAPIGNGVQLDLGKFITHMGAEVIEGYDGWNYNFSRSFLFGLAIPFTHTGLRVAYTLNDKISFMGMVANGSDNTTDNNSGKTLGAQIAITPVEYISLLLNWVGGPDKANSNDVTNIFDMVLDIALPLNTLLQLNFDYGRQANSSGLFAGKDAEWWGIGGIIRHDYNKWFSINLRGEFFNDQGGTRASFGSAAGSATFTPGQELWEITVTPEFRINQNLVVRFEYRHDQSNKLVFYDQNPGVLTSGQDTAAINALFFF